MSLLTRYTTPLHFLSVDVGHLLGAVRNRDGSFRSLHSGVGTDIVVEKLGTDALRVHQGFYSVNCTIAPAVQQPTLQILLELNFTTVVLFNPQDHRAVAVAGILHAPCPAIQ